MTLEPATDRGRRDRIVHSAASDSFKVPVSPCQMVYTKLHCTQQEEERNRQDERCAAVHWAMVCKAPWRMWQIWCRRCRRAAFIDTSL